jgi:hypothetical protein
LCQGREIFLNRHFRPLARLDEEQNPNAPAVKREAEEGWGRQPTSYSDALKRVAPALK